MTTGREAGSPDNDDGVNAASDGAEGSMPDQDVSESRAPRDTRTADDPFDRRRLERLRAIADPQHPENDPLADVDTQTVSPGDGGTTGPDDVVDLDWDVDLTLAEGDELDPVGPDD